MRHIGGLASLARWVFNIVSRPSPLTRHLPQLLEHVLEHGGPGKTVTFHDNSDKAKGDEKAAQAAPAKKGQAKKDEDKKKKGEERRIVAVYLHVQTDNDEAKTFYEKHGFKEVERLDEYYHRGIEPRSAWVLEKRQ